LPIVLTSIWQLFWDTTTLASEAVRCVEVGTLFLKKPPLYPAAAPKVSSGKQVCGYF
jgi:hypothetical protein